MALLRGLFVVSLGLLVKSSITPSPGQVVQFQISQPGKQVSGPCITAQDGSNGGAVIIKQCSGPTEERAFTVIAGGSSTGKGPAGRLQNRGSKCLDVTNGTDKAGTNLQLFECFAGNTNQMFNVNHDLSIQWAGHNKCLQVDLGGEIDGLQIQIQVCDGSDKQKWDVEPISDPYYMIESSKMTALNHCLSATSTANGAPVFIAPCNTQAFKHTWAFPFFVPNAFPDGTPHNPGDTPPPSPGTISLSFGDGQPAKCLDVTNGRDAPGTKLQLWDCTKGNKNQNWFPTTNFGGPIVWNSGGKFPKCLDLTDGKNITGTQLQIWNCTGGPNQQWQEAEPILFTPPPQ